MNLEQAQARLAGLNARLRSGAITPAQYASAVNELRVQDQAGYTWQPDPSGRGWLFWDGQQWRPGALPLQPIPPPPPPQPGPSVPLQPVRVTAPRPGQDWRQFKAQLLTPARFGEISRNVPLRRRPRAWWDVLSIWAGAACGYFWLLYALVRGLPRLRIGNSLQNSWLDLLPSLALLLLPILLCVFRQAMMPALTRWFNGLQRMPLSRKIGWVVAIALVILFLQTNNPLLAQREGLDLITPLLTFAIPLGLVWFRKETKRRAPPHG